MKYPIDVESHLNAIRLRQEVDASTEDFIRRYVSLVNNAYSDGKAEKPGYPMDPESEIRKRAEKIGFSDVEDTVVEMVSCIIRWMNDAYAQGMQDAKAEAA